MAHSKDFSLPWLSSFLSVSQKNIYTHKPPIHLPSSLFSLFLITLNVRNSNACISNLNSLRLQKRLPEVKIHLLVQEFAGRESSSVGGSAHQEVVGLIPAEDTHLGGSSILGQGAYKRQPIDVSYVDVSLSVLSPLSKVHDHILRP